MDLIELLETVYKIYKDDLATEDYPPIREKLNYGLGDILELKGNIYVYLWKKTNYGYQGLLATPYTLLAHPIHPRVKTDSPLYEVMAITDIYLPLTDKMIKKYITDRIEVLEDKNILEEKINNSIKRKKIYHPIREKFLRDEARRTAFLIEEYLQEGEETVDAKKGIVIKIPKKVLENLEIPQRLAASTEQETAENETFLIVQLKKNTFSLIVKDYSLLGQEVKILLGNEVIYKGLLDSDTIIVEIDSEISPSILADLLRVEV